MVGRDDAGSIPMMTLYAKPGGRHASQLDTERSLFQQQDQLAQSEGEVTQNRIQFYRAPGGGWSP